jgi:hypothetical protein
MRNALTRPFCATGPEDATASYSAASTIRAGFPELAGIEGAEGISWWAFNTFATMTPPTPLASVPTKPVRASRLLGTHGQNPP